MKKIEYAISIDKLKICLSQPDGLFEYLKQNTSFYDNNNIRFIDEGQGFYLTIIDEDDEHITATLTITVSDKDLKIGTFIFNSSKKYKGYCFFTFENSALYEVSSIIDGEKYNYIQWLQYIMDFYHLDFNNITLMEVAFDTNVNYIKKIRSLIKDVDNYDLYINAKKVVDKDKTINNYGEFYSRTRTKLSTMPTLYFSQSKDTDMSLRIYSKTRELEQNSPNKIERYEKWTEFSSRYVYRVELVFHNTNFREFVERASSYLPEYGNHDNALSLICLKDFLMRLFVDSSDRLIYFRNKHTREKVSLIDIVSI